MALDRPGAANAKQIANEPDIQEVQSRAPAKAPAIVRMMGKERRREKTTWIRERPQVRCFKREMTMVRKEGAHQGGLPRLPGPVSVTTGLVAAAGRSAPVR